MHKTWVRSVLWVLTCSQWVTECTKAAYSFVGLAMVWAKAHCDGERTLVTVIVSARCAGTKEWVCRVPNQMGGIRGESPGG